MRQFDYIKVVGEMSEKDLNRYGREGWELITHTVVYHREIYIFKKELKL
jgi:hypothetical protein